MQAFSVSGWGGESRMKMVAPPGSGTEMGGMVP